MVNLGDLCKWLRRGRQRRAIAQVLIKPMTAKEICNAASDINDRIRLRDVWFVVRQMIQNNLATCLNPQDTTGRLYFLTEEGRQAVQNTFGIAVEPIAQDLDWHQYAFVKRARTRQWILLTLAKPRFELPGEATAAKIRRHISDVFFPIGLNPVLRALKSLTDACLISCAGTTTKRHLKVYQLTRSACILAHFMITESFLITPKIAVSFQKIDNNDNKSHIPHVRNR